MRRQLLLLVVTLAAAFPATAQLTEQEAVKQIKDASKAQLKSFKQIVAAAVSTLDASLQSLEDQLTQASDAATVGALVGNVAIDYMTSLNDAYHDAKGSVEFTAIDALDALADGADLVGIYPADFYYGSGGVLDKHREKLLKAGDKSRDAAFKRLEKIVKKAEKAANIALSVELSFPTRVNAGSVDQAGGVGASQTMTVDVVLACSDLDVASDGLLFVAGESDNSSMAMDANFFSGTNPTQSTSVTPDLGTGRFVVAFDELGEGSYVFQARQSSDGSPHSSAEIGLR